MPSDGKLMPSHIARPFVAIVIIASVLIPWESASAQTKPPPSQSDDQIDEQPSQEPTTPPRDEADTTTAPTALMTADPLKGPVPLTVIFDGSGSDGDISSYSFDFGDGSAPISGKGGPQTATHTYKSAGTYTAVLTVVAGQFKDTALATIVINEIKTPTPSVSVEEAEPGNEGTETEDSGGPSTATDPDDSTGGGAGDDDGRREDRDDGVAADQGPVHEDERSLLVQSVPAPGDLSLAPKALALSALLAALLILLIGFPADMFNATLLEHYEEISGWFDWWWVVRLRGLISGLPGIVVVPAFAASGALLYSLLEPHFGFDRGSFALLTGLFLSFLLVSLVYDVARSRYIKRRFAVDSRIRAQLLGLVAGLVLVLLSRLAGFHPGYIYGVFTAVVFRAALEEQKDGKALAVVSIWLGAIAVAAWILWIPVKEMAEEGGASFLVLALDAFLADLWIIGLGFIVFGLAPLRFFYGERVKAWSFRGWLAIYGAGMFAFVHALLLPEDGFYEHSAEASLGSVLALFVGFGLFSLTFWGYFRYRHLWKNPKPGTT